jgi:hypothetical protein
MAKAHFPHPPATGANPLGIPDERGKSEWESSLHAGKLSLTLLKSCQRLGESFLNAGKSSLIDAATSGKAFVLEQYSGKQGGGNSPCVAHR